MQEKNWSWRLKFASLLFFSSSSIAVFPLGANAQLIPDSTLSEEPSRVAPQGLRDLIEGGAIRDTTLFHSFREFNVNDAQQVYFANPDGIANILTRVTGNNISRILGRLGVLGSANLFLINPNGIIFGSNARLDVAGSFTATTADSVIFDNYEFSATNPEAPPLLTINVTPGLQYGSNHPSRTIRSEGILSVGQDLNLAAGNLYVESQLHAGNNLTLVGMDSVEIRDSSHQPFIASASGNLLVQGNQGVDIFVLNHPDSLELRQRSGIQATTQSGNGGNITLETRDLVLLRNNSSISTTAGQAGAGGDGGNITLEAGFVVAVPQENSDITANAFEGRGGNINITTNAIYGLEFRNQLTSLSDITASSQLGINGCFSYFPELYRRML